MPTSPPPLFGDSATTAQALQTAVAALVAQPSDDYRWRRARGMACRPRAPICKPRSFCSGNPVVDDWEARPPIRGRWTKGLIDYVDANAYGGLSEENPLSTLNVIATPKFRIGATEVDATTITADTIRSLHEADGIEANVASAITPSRFLLWAGSERHRAGGGARALYRLRAGRGLHRRQLRPPRRLSDRGDRPAGARPAGDGRQRWAEGGAAPSLSSPTPPGRAHHADRYGQPLYGELAGERTAGPDAERPEEEQDCFRTIPRTATIMTVWASATSIWAAMPGPMARSSRGRRCRNWSPRATRRVNTQLTAELEDSVAKLGALKQAAGWRLAYDQMPAGRQ